MLTEESSPARMNSKSSAGDAFHCDDMRQACGKELCMRQFVGDSFPDKICHLIFRYISQFTCKAHIDSCSDEPKDLAVLRTKRGALYNGGGGHGASRYCGIGLFFIR